MEPIEGVTSAVVLFPLFKRARLDKIVESEYKRDWYTIQMLPVTYVCPEEER